LRMTETLLLERSVIERLAGRIKLGIVTGRPGRDAHSFLETHDLHRFFDAVVTMEQAPLKPSPEPVRLALMRLGVDRAWMVGDTPDDMRSARAAGVLPLGVVAPADDPTIARLALVRAGAGRVLEKITDIEELLP
jgi:HAD superfamily phosphatase